MALILKKNPNPQYNAGNKRGYQKNEKPINENLRFNPYVYLVGEGGMNKVTYQDAQDESDRQELDLCKVAEKEGLPLCKIFNYEKFVYQQKKTKQKQVHQEVKEIQLSANIAENDMKIKAKNAEKFISQGNKVKVVLQLRGRENGNREYNKASLLKFIVMCEDFAAPESIPMDEGKKCICFLKPKK